MRTISPRRRFWFVVAALAIIILVVRSGVLTAVISWGVAARPVLGLQSHWRWWLAIGIGVTGVRTYFRATQDAILGAVTGLVVCDIPLFLLFESGVIRSPGLTVITIWVLIIGAGIGTICGVIAVPWIGALVGAFALTAVFLTGAAPWEVHLVPVALAIGAFFGCTASIAALAVRRRFAIIMD
jgi:hypothetical protein